MLGGALAWLGTLDSLLLWQRHATVGDLFCPVKNGCDAVLASPFATVGGISVAVFGAIYYLAILAAFLGLVGCASTVWKQRILEAALWLLVVGATFSAGLMYLQFAVIRSFCPLCTLSAAITVALIAVTVWAKRTLDGRPWEASRSTALTLGFFAVVPAAILIGSGPVAPAPARAVRLNLELAQASGPREAAVQLVVFSDYQCSFCRELAPVVQRLRLEFADRVLVAFRDYPIETHPRAFAAAVAAHCAGEQGAFWAYHDRLFSGTGDFSDERLRATAVALGLKMEDFATCLAAERATGAVRRSQEDAAANGLQAVPSVFLNGRQLEGKLTYDRLAELIREALAGAEKAQKSTAP